MEDKKMLVVEETAPVTDEKAVVAPEVKVEETPPMTLEPEAPKKRRGSIWFVILAAFLAGALVGGVITFVTGMAKIETAGEETEKTQTPVPTTQPTATPAATKLDRSTISIQVLNGSGVSGAAATAKTLLEKLGYKDVQTGNASLSNLTETEISIKDAKKEYLELLTGDLEDEYDLATKASTLVSTSKFDAVITIGKN